MFHAYPSILHVFNDVIYCDMLCIIIYCFQSLLLFLAIWRDTSRHKNIKIVVNVLF